MHRGYRRIVVAACGLALGGAAPPKEDSVGKAAAEQIEPTASASPDYAPYPHYNPDPCYQAKNHDAADLCAQWRTSIAAEKAAHEAGRATSWSIVATVLNILSLLAVAVALLFTRETNRIARDTSNAQLRPYVHAHLIEWKKRGHGGEFYIDFQVKFTNAGQTPAKELQLTAVTFFTENGADPPKVEMILEPTSQRQPLGPGCDILTAARSVPLDDLNEVWLGKKRLFIAGIAQYGDNLSSATRKTTCYYELRFGKVDGEFNWVWWDYAGSNNEAT